MWEEWLNKLSVRAKFDRKITPNDDKEYYISNGVIEFTRKILAEYGKLRPPNEGFVYWAGRINKNKIVVNAAYAPDTSSSIGRVEVKPKSNVNFVLFLSKYKLVHISNVHTHSGAWVGHSNGDNYMAPFKKSGLLSIVVPFYGTKEKFNIKTCGVHRFDNNCFIQLSNKYKTRRFKIIKVESTIIDARIKNEL